MSRSGTILSAVRGGPDGCLRPLSLTMPALTMCVHCLPVATITDDHVPDFCHTCGMMATLSPWLALAAVIVAGAGAAAIFVSDSRERQREAPMQRAMQAQPVTFAARVNVKALRYSGDLIVHGDRFEVRELSWPQRRGDRWLYHAPDTTMQVTPGWLRDWIEITSQPPTRDTRVEIRSSLWDGGPRMTRVIWDVLVRAGVHPASAPPR